MKSTAMLVLVGLVGAVGAIVLAASAVQAQQQPPTTDARVLLSELRQRIDRWIKDPRTSAEPRDVVAALSACGEPAVPLVIGALSKEEYSDCRDALVTALVEMPGTAGPKALRQLYEGDDVGVPLKGYIVTGLCNWLTQRGAGIRKLPPDALEVLEDAILSDGDAAPGAIASALYQLPRPVPERTATALVKRLVREAEAPPLSPGGSDQKPPRDRRTDMLRSVICGFSYFREPAAPMLRAERSKTGNAEVIRWIDIALGICGDSEVAPRLEGMVRDEKDPDTRATMIGAYAASAKEKALPLLKALDLEDAYAVGRRSLDPVPDAIRRAIRDIVSGPHGFDPPPLPGR